MNVLRKNLLFCMRNQYKIRAIACFVNSTTTVNSSSGRLLRKSPIQSISCENSIPCNSLTIQSARFSSEGPTVNQLDYERFCAETLDELCDYIEELVESVNDLATADVLNKDGVLTVCLGSTHGTYVINKQSPNKQIWLSSPTSGPKRFDFAYAKDGSKNGYWIYKHTGETLHEILDTEFTEITKTKTTFQSLAFGLRC